MPLIASLVMGSLQLGKGVYDQIKGAQIRKNNPRPTYNIPQPYYDNLNISQSMASRGLPQQSLDYYYGQQGQNNAGSINAILQNGGSSMDISNVFGTTSAGNRQILGMDAQANDANKKILMDTNNQFGEQLDKKWQVNKYAPYADKSQLASAYLQSAMAGFGAAADTVSSGFAAKAMQNIADQYGDLMNGKKPPAVAEKTSAPPDIFAPPDSEPNADPWSYYSAPSPQPQFSPAAPSPYDFYSPMGMQSPPPQNFNYYNYQATQTPNSGLFGGYQYDPNNPFGQ